MKKQSKQLIATAYHEAGHAVAAYFVNSKFKMITIKPSDHTLGSISLNKTLKESDLYEISSKTRQEIDKYLMVLCAGYLAEKKYNKNTRSYSFQMDFNNSLGLLSKFCSTEEESVAYLNYIIIKTTNKLLWNEKDSLSWNAVKKLAEKLLEYEKLNYKLAVSFIKEALNTGK